MTTLSFSIPMVAQLDDNHRTARLATTQLSAEELTTMIAQIITESPEFRQAMEILNDGGTWCIADVDYDALNVSPS